MIVDELYKYLWAIPAHAKVYVRVHNQLFALLGTDLTEDGNELILDIKTEPRHEVKE